MTLADRMARLLAAHGTTPNAVAKAAGMERMKVYRIVNGQTPNPGVLTVARIVAAAGGTMAELFAD